MDVKLKAKGKTSNEIDLTLGSTNDGRQYEQDLRTIVSIATKDKRNLVELPIPDNVSMLQDMGTEPVEISLEGEINGIDASKTIQELYKLYDAGESVEFYSDLVAMEDINEVDIVNFQVTKTVGSAYHYGYKLDLKEHSGNIST